MILATEETTHRKAIVKAAGRSSAMANAWGEEDEESVGGVEEGLDVSFA